MRHLTYREKLKKIKLLSLHARRIQHQLTVVFKMKNKNIDLSFDDFFEKNTYSKTRGNIFKLIVPKSKTKIRQKFFANSVVNYWNMLKSTDINVRTDKDFKKKIASFFVREKIW